MGSVCTIINKSLANVVVLNSQESFWVQSPDTRELKISSNEQIKNIDVINTSGKRNIWASANVNVIVVGDGHRPIIGRDLFSQLGLSPTQTKQVSNVDQNQCLIGKK